MLASIGLGEILWSLLVGFLMFTYLIMLFTVITDLFRDRELSGWSKALWALFLFFLPLISLTVYLIARGQGMSSRSAAEARDAQAQMDGYIRSVAAASPVEQIGRAKELLDGGVIDATEFERLKRAALA
jgi:hypothetical protein